MIRRNVKVILYSYTYWTYKDQLYPFVHFWKRR